MSTKIAPRQQKTPPRIAFGGYEVVYRQTPYVNRYLEVYYNLPDMPSKSGPLKLPVEQLGVVYAMYQGALQDEASASANVTRWEKFVENIGAHDEWLDAQPE